MVQQQSGSSDRPSPPKDPRRRSRQPTQAGGRDSGPVQRPGRPVEVGDGANTGSPIDDALADFQNTPASFGGGFGRPDDDRPRGTDDDPESDDDPETDDNDEDDQGEDGSEDESAGGDQAADDGSQDEPESDDAEWSGASNESLSESNRRDQDAALDSEKLGAGAAASGEEAATSIMAGLHRWLLVGIFLLVFVVAGILGLVLLVGMAGGSTGGGTTQTGGGGGGGGGGLSGNVQADVNKLIANKNVTIYPGGVTDLKGGIIDERVVALLLSIAEKHKINVTSLKSGHSQFNSSGSVSAHWTGEAVDIGSVDGTICAGGRDACWRLASEVAKLKGKLAPSQVIYATAPQPSPPGVAMADHADHVHVGY